MDEKDIENSFEFEKPEEKIEQDNSMLSLNSAEISDGLEEFEGLFDEQPTEENVEAVNQEAVNETKEEIIEDFPEETVETVEQEPLEDFEEEIEEADEAELIEESFEANLNKAAEMQGPQTEEEKKLADSYAKIFDNDSYSENFIESEKEIEENQKIEEAQNITMTSDIIPNITDDFEEEIKEEVNELITVRPVKFQQFENTPPRRSIKKNLDIMQDVSMHISVELGRTKSSIREVMEMEEGSVVELEKIAGEQVEIFVNEKLVAKGEVIVIEDKFGVRVTSTSV